MSFHSYRVVFCAPIPMGLRIPILDPIAWVIAFKLHGEGIRGSQALSICNTQFIKEHKPSNHICAKIKSHVYTTEWTVYHNTYHVKRYNKANTNVIYYINDKNVWYSGSEVQIRWNSPKPSRAPQGRRLGDEHLEVLVVLVALSELPRVGRNWATVEYPRGKSREEARVSTQLVLNKYNTNYEALRLADWLH